MNIYLTKVHPRRRTSNGTCYTLPSEIAYIATVDSEHEAGEAYDAAKRRNADSLYLICSDSIVMYGLARAMAVYRCWGGSDEE